jgi:hypothetical protein
MGAVGAVPGVGVNPIRPGERVDGGSGIRRELARRFVVHPKTMAVTTLAWKIRRNSLSNAESTQIANHRRPDAVRGHPVAISGNAIPWCGARCCRNEAPRATRPVAIAM